MRNVAANPLDYVEGRPYGARRRELSAWLDSTNPDLEAFRARGGKMIVTIGTNDTLASPGAQLDYYQRVLDTMGRNVVDSFARLFVVPQAGHGLRGTVATRAGDGRDVAARPLATAFDKVRLLSDWVERGVAPGASVVATGGASDTALVCGYPRYPHFVAGPSNAAASYECR